MFGKLFTRRAPASLPDFLIIGAPKSGTTSLFRYIGTHPNVAVPKRKEIHYFDENFARGEAWYRRQFPQPKPGQITGDATTAYLYAPETPPRARALLPDAKIMAVLRDPVRRVISHYHHNVRRGRVKGDFESYFREALSERGERPADQSQSFIRYPVQWGFYKDQIERWFKYYPREQFLFLRFEDFAADAEGQMREVFQFLGLPPMTGATGEIFNAGPSYKMPESETIQTLTNVYRERNAGLENLIGPKFVW